MWSSVPVNTPARARRSTLVVALLVGVVASSCAIQGSSSPAGTASPSAPEPSPTSAATAPSPSSPELGPCDPASLAARVTGWTGAAGHRIASVELLNAGSVSCVTFALARPQLVDGRDSILIDGAPPGASAVLEIAPGGRLTTEVQDSNYCGADPVSPVTVAFVLPEGLGRVVAAPDSPTSLDGLPPCLGPGGPGTIEMQPWQP